MFKNNQSSWLTGMKNPVSFHNIQTTTQSDTSLPNEWTQYTEPVQSMPEIPLPALTQHFLAALAGCDGRIGTCAVVCLTPNAHCLR